MGQCSVEQIAGSGVDDALGLARRAGRVKGEQRVFRLDPFRFAVAGGFRHGLVVPDIPVCLPVHIAAGAFDRQAGMHALDPGHGLVGIHFQGDGFAAAYAFIGGDDGTGTGILNAIFQGFRGEAAKHDGVNGADAGAGQHGVGGFGNHRHVDHHAIAFFNATAFQHITEFADFLEQLLVGNVLVLIRLITFPDNGRLVGPFWQMAIDTVVAYVEGGALEPGSTAFVEVPVTDRVPGGFPVQ